MKDWIFTTVNRYKGKIFAWDVANEAIDTNSATIKHSAWYKIDDFLCKAFKWARQADPTLFLYYNDFGIEGNTGYMTKKSNAAFEIVKDLKNRGCGIDGIGFQLHENLNFDQYIPGVIANMHRYA